MAATLWRGTAGLDMDQAQRAVDQLGRLRLVAVTGSGITLHDAVRDALREGLGETELARVHGLFLGAAAEDPLQPESPGTPTDAGFVITPGPSPAALVDALRVIAPALAGLPVMIPSPVGQDDPVFQMSSAALGDDFVVKFAWALSTARSTSTARYDRTTLTRQQRRRSAALRAFSPTSFITQRDGSCRRNPAHGLLTHLGGRLRMPVHSWEPSGEPSSADIRPHRTYWSVRFISLTRHPDTTRHFDRH